MAMQAELDLGAVARRITEDAQTAAQKSAMRYDREGDAHFDIASALMKSLHDGNAPINGRKHILSGDLLKLKDTGAGLHRSENRKKWIFRG